MFLYDPGHHHFLPKFLQFPLKRSPCFCSDHSPPSPLPIHEPKSSCIIKVGACHLLPPHQLPLKTLSPKASHCIKSLPMPSRHDTIWPYLMLPFSLAHRPLHLNRPPTFAKLLPSTWPSHTFFQLSGFFWLPFISEVSGLNINSLKSSPLTPYTTRFSSFLPVSWNLHLCFFIFLYVIHLPHQTVSITISGTCLLKWLIYFHGLMSWLQGTLELLCVHLQYVFADFCLCRITGEIFLVFWLHKLALAPEEQSWFLNVSSSLMTGVPVHRLSGKK